LNTLVAVVGLIMLVFGIGLVRAFGDDLMESIPVTNFWLYLAMPISGALILLYIVRQQWRAVRALRGEGAEEQAGEVIPI
jgi:TRAP-type C4-dicarboxylate transport system permease small subunit